MPRSNGSDSANAEWTNFSRSRAIDAGMEGKRVGCCTSTRRMDVEDGIVQVYIVLRSSHRIPVYTASLCSSRFQSSQTIC